MFGRHRRKWQLSTLREAARKASDREGYRECVIAWDTLFSLSMGQEHLAEKDSVPWAHTWDTDESEELPQSVLLQLLGRQINSCPLYVVYEGKRCLVFYIDLKYSAANGTGSRYPAVDGTATFTQDILDRMCSLILVDADLIVDDIS